MVMVFSHITLGTYEYANGNKCTTEWKDGKMNGKGKY